MSDASVTPCSVVSIGAPAVSSLSGCSDPVGLGLLASVASASSCALRASARCFMSKCPPGLASSGSLESLSFASLALSWGFHVLSPSAANGLACCAVGEITTGPSGELMISCVLAVGGMGEFVRSVTGPAADTSCGVSPEILCHIAPGGCCCGVSAASKVRWVAVTGELPGLLGVA